MSLSLLKQFLEHFLLIVSQQADFECVGYVLKYSDCLSYFCMKNNLFGWNVSVIRILVLPTVSSVFNFVSKQQEVTMVWEVVHGIDTLLLKHILTLVMLVTSQARKRFSLGKYFCKFLFQSVFTHSFSMRHFFSVEISQSSCVVLWWRKCQCLFYCVFVQKAF